MAGERWVVGAKVGSASAGVPFLCPPGTTIKAVGGTVLPMFGTCIAAFVGRVGAFAAMFGTCIAAFVGRLGACILRGIGRQRQQQGT